MNTTTTRRPAAPVARARTAPPPNVQRELPFEGDPLERRFRERRPTDAERAWMEQHLRELRESFERRLGRRAGG